MPRMLPILGILSNEDFPARWVACVLVEDGLPRIVEKLMNGVVGHNGLFRVRVIYG